MSLVLEEREDILRDNNTAQNVLLDILKDINPNISELSIKTELSGELDLSVCNHLTHLRTIRIGNGKITGVHQIPDKITKFACGGNLIIELTNLPKSLVSLDVGHNYCTTVNVSELLHLEELICNDNRIDDLGVLPNSLVSIHCQNNNLKYLDLKGKTKLRTLNISNNPLVIVDNLPETIHEYIAENNQIAASREDERQRTDVRKRIDYSDALQRFFKMKSTYETELRAKKRAAFHRGNTKREGRRLAAAVKPKCVNCRRPVGSLFVCDVNGYTAVCGDTHKPCNLDIKLTRGNFEMNETILRTFSEALSDTKQRIVQLKMDSMFGYSTEATVSKQFNKKVEEFNKDSIIYKEELARHTSLYERGDIIQKKQDLIHATNTTIRKMLDEYENNHGIISTIIHTYKTELIPEIENLRRLKYDVMEMTHIDHENQPTISILQSMEVSPGKLEYVYGEQPAVIKFSV